MICDPIWGRELELKNPCFRHIKLPAFKSIFTPARGERACGEGRGGAYYTESGVRVT